MKKCVYTLLLVLSCSISFAANTSNYPQRTQAPSKNTTQKPPSTPTPPQEVSTPDTYPLQDNSYMGDKKNGVEEDHESMHNANDDNLPQSNDAHMVTRYTHDQN
jgi:hypothetical protein